MVSIRGLKPEAAAGVAAEDQVQWRQEKMTRVSLLLLPTCCVCSLALHTGQQKPLTLEQP